LNSWRIQTITIVPSFSLPPSQFPKEAVYFSMSGGLKERVTRALNSSGSVNHLHARFLSLLVTECLPSAPEELRPFRTIRTDGPYALVNQIVLQYFESHGMKESGTAVTAESEGSVTSSVDDCRASLSLESDGVWLKEILETRESSDRSENFLSLRVQLHVRIEGFVDENSARVSVGRGTRDISNGRTRLSLPNAVDLGTPARKKTAAWRMGNGRMGLTTRISNFQMSPLDDSGAAEDGIGCFGSPMVPDAPIDSDSVGDDRGGSGQPPQRSMRRRNELQLSLRATARLGARQVQSEKLPKPPQLELREPPAAGLPQSPGGNASGQAVVDPWNSPGRSERSYTVPARGQEERAGEDVHGSEKWQTWSVKKILFRPVSLREPEDAEELLTPRAVRDLADCAKTTPGKR
jgi:hypothetical protein